MKVHNDLKELLKEYDKYLDLYKKVGVVANRSVRATNFLTFNRLALGKPEPLAKNKQTENKCEHLNNSKNNNNLWTCDDCGKDLS